MNTATATVTAETVTDEQIGELLVTGIIGLECNELYHPTHNKETVP